jgi:hypothetical protein
MAENKKTLTVTQQVKELVYDIQNKAYLTGQAREAAGKSYQVASNMQASDDDENSYQIRRSLANAFSSLKSLCPSVGLMLYEHGLPGDSIVKLSVSIHHTSKGLIYYQIEKPNGKYIRKYKKG